MPHTNSLRRKASINDLKMAKVMWENVYTGPLCSPALPQTSQATSIRRRPAPSSPLSPRAWSATSPKPTRVEPDFLYRGPHCDLGSLHAVQEEDSDEAGLSGSPSPALSVGSILSTPSSGPTTPEPSESGHVVGATVDAPVQENALKLEIVDDRSDEDRPVSLQRFGLADESCKMETTPPRRPPRNPLRTQMITPQSEISKRNEPNYPSMSSPPQSPSPVRHSIPPPMLPTRQPSLPKRRNGGNRPIFVSGLLSDPFLLSLLLPSILQQPSTQSAQLLNHSLHTLSAPNAHYPLLVPSSSASSITGFLLDDLSTENRLKIRNFHPRFKTADGTFASLFRAIGVDVILRSGRQARATTFVWDERAGQQAGLPLCERQWQAKGLRKAVGRLAREGLIPIF